MFGFVIITITKNTVAMESMRNTSKRTGKRADGLLLSFEANYGLSRASHCSLARKTWTGQETVTCRSLLMKISQKQCKLGSLFSENEFDLIASRLPQMTVVSSVVCVLVITFGRFYGNSNNTMIVTVLQIVTTSLSLSWSTRSVSGGSYISTFIYANFDRNVTLLAN